MSMANDGSDDQVLKALTGGQAALIGITGGPLAALIAGILPPLLEALGARAQERISATVLFAQDEINRRLKAGDQPRSDLVSGKNDSARELLEGIIIKARDAYESRKCKHLGHLLASCLFNETEDLSQAFFFLSIAERLAYHQYIILRVYDLKDIDPKQVHLSDETFGADPPPERTQIILQLLELIQLGFLDEGGGETPAAGSMASRWDQSSITFSNPAGCRISGIGRTFAAALGLHLVPEEFIESMVMRLGS